MQNSYDMQQWYNSNGYNTAQQSGGFYGSSPQHQDFASSQYFIPTPQADNISNNVGGQEDFENEPPLLEELGVNFDHIRQKTLAVLNPLGFASKDIIMDQDLAGPLVFCLLFGASLLLQAKIHFGHIYGIGLVGCVGMYLLLNLMAVEGKNISFTCTASILGYCILPMAILSMLAVVLSLQGLFGYVIATTAILWCASASSKLFTIALSMEGQQLLVAYPCSLLYAVFALLAIF